MRMEGQNTREEGGLPRKFKDCLEEVLGAESWTELQGDGGMAASKGWQHK